MNQIISNFDNTIIQLTDGNIYTISAHDGSIRTFKYRNGAGAFKTIMIVNVNKDEISIIPGVALRPNFNKHQLVHELFYTISSNQHNYFNKDGIAYTKTENKIDYYDKNLEDYNMNYNPSSD